MLMIPTKVRVCKPPVVPPLMKKRPLFLGPHRRRRLKPHLVYQFAICKVPLARMVGKAALHPCAVLRQYLIVTEWHHIGLRRLVDVRELLTSRRHGTRLAVSRPQFIVSNRLRLPMGRWALYPTVQLSSDCLDLTILFHPRLQ